MRTKHIGAVIGAGCLLMAWAGAQAKAETILKHSFEDSDGGWVSLSPTGTLTLTHEAANVKEGKGALHFAYGVRKGELSMMLLPITEGALTKTKAFRFWVKTDSATTMAFVLQEKDGGRYYATFATPKDKWQQVELAPSDLVLGDGNDDPKDPNGKLDLDKVENIGLADMAQFFAQADENLAKLFGVTEGAHTLAVDELTVTDDVLPKASASVEGELRLDTFVRPQLSWLTLGEGLVTRVEGKPLEGAGIQAKYHQAPAKVIGFIKSFGIGKVKGATKMAFSVASLKPAKLIVQVEEKGGGKYNTTIEVPGSPERKEISLNFSDFKAAQDSKDTNDKLDMDQVYQLIVIDASGLLDQADADNTLWLNNFRVTLPK